MPSPGTRALSWLDRHRDRIPFVTALSRSLAENPTGAVSRLWYLVTGADRGAPAATTVPDAPVRVFVGPTNYAGQGYAWARALSNEPGVEARALAVDVPGALRADADTHVAMSIYRHSRRWQQAELASITGFTHVLWESMRPLLGSRFPHPVAEIEALRSTGLTIAAMAHGTDVRSPAAHLAAHPWSPFGADPRRAHLQATADRHRRWIDELGLVAFVSTPDLLADLPGAFWCPVVVDLDRWRPGPRLPLESEQPPLVVHAPSSPLIKGTDLVEPAMLDLQDRGLIRYRRLAGLNAAAMVAQVQAADLVLDQFRLGSYGVAACEAMAAGRLVVGHVTQNVREHVQAATGLALPILESAPTTVADTVLAALADPADSRALADRGRRFVEAVHSGPVSAQVLLDRWLRPAGRLASPP